MASPGIGMGWNRTGDGSGDGSELHLIEANLHAARHLHRQPDCIIQ